MTVIVDSSGLSTTNKGSYIEDRWKREKRRQEAVMLDALGYEGWKSVRDYGKRWLVEVVFSSSRGRWEDPQVEEVPQPEGRGVPQGHAVQQVPVNQAVDDGTRIGGASES